MFRFILLLQIVSMIQCQYDFPWENNYDESNFIPEQQPSKSKSTSPDPQILPQPTKPQSIQPTKRAPLQRKSKQMHIVPTTFQYRTIQNQYVNIHACMFTRDSINHSVGRSVGRSVGQSVYRSVGRSVGRSLLPKTSRICPITLFQQHATKLSMYTAFFHTFFLISVHQSYVCFIYI